MEYNKNSNSNHSVFLSEHDISDGDLYLQTVEKNISLSSVFVLISSNHEYINNSKHIKAEITKYNTLKENGYKDKSSFRVFLANDFSSKQLSDEVLPSILSTNQTINFNSQNILDENNDTLNSTFLKLIQSIESINKIKEQRNATAKIDKIIKNASSDITETIENLISNYNSISSILKLDSQHIIKRENVEQKNLHKYDLISLNAMLEYLNTVIFEFKKLVNRKYNFDYITDNRVDILKSISPTMFSLKSNIDIVIKEKTNQITKDYTGKSLESLINLIVKKENLGSSFDPDNQTDAIKQFKTYDISNKPEHKIYNEGFISLEYFSYKKIFFIKVYKIRVKLRKQ